VKAALYVRVSITEQAEEEGTIEAFQWNGQDDIENGMVNRGRDTSVATERGDISVPAGWGLIPTLEGPHLVTPGDWIIKGVAGELYPCKPEIFEATYEPVEEYRRAQGRERDDGRSAG